MAPNPIDFDKVFAEFGRLGETGNYVVLSFVCLTFGLYAVGLVFARRADKKDYFEVNYTIPFPPSFAHCSCLIHFYVTLTHQVTYLLFLKELRHG